jgi:hypothetical protein
MELSIVSIMEWSTINGVSLQCVFAYFCVCKLILHSFFFTANPDCWTWLEWEKSGAHVAFSCDGDDRPPLTNAPLPLL